MQIYATKTNIDKLIILEVIKCEHGDWFYKRTLNNTNLYSLLLPRGYPGDAYLLYKTCVKYGYIYRLLLI